MLLALLLATRAAAEWVEISQQHYRKPVHITTRNQQLHQNPTKNTYEQDVLWTRDTYLNHNVQNISNTYQDQDLEDSTKSTYHNDVSIKKPARDYFVDHDEPLYPTSSPHSDLDVKSMRNPFLQDAQHNPTRKTYFDPNVSQASVVNIHMDKKLESATIDTYFNHSITEHNWNRNTPRPGSGWTDEIVTTVPNFENWNDNTYRLNNEKQDGAPNIVRIKDETVSGKIERVPNIGSIKRVQLANTPVKSPVINSKVPERSSVKRKGNHFSDELDIETDIFNSHGDAVSKKLSNNLKQKLSSTEETTLKDQRKNGNPIEEFMVSISSSQKHSFPHKFDVNHNIVTKHTKDNIRFEQNAVPDITETFVRPEEGNKISSTNDKKTKLQEEFITTEDFQPDFATKNDNTDSKKQNITNIENDKNEKHRGTTKFNKTHNEEKVLSSEKGENLDSSSGEIKVNTMENILKFMKVVADTISKNTRRSGANGKITYLNELKHSLLANIKERIDATWPEDTSPSSRRHSRAASPRGHVEFPSSESALMTISFLTFAVFLIKLVLQVIQTYKHKTMVMAPLMVATAGKKLTGN